MRVVCPNCSTAFEVDGNLVPETGRQVRCYNCGHVWHQDPVPETPGPAPDMAGAPGDPAVEAAPAAEADEMAPGPEDQASIDAMFETDAGPPLEGEPGEGGGAVEEAYQDSTGLDMAAEPTGDAVADTFGPVETEVPDHSEDMAPAPPPDLGEEPEPIPDMFASPPPEYEEGGRARLRAALRWTGLGLAAALVLGLLFAWYWRAAVVTSYPGMAGVYGAVGIDVRTVGLGLTFSDVTPERVARDGNEVLILRGIINNTTQRRRDVPDIRMVLRNKGGDPVGGTVIEPPVETLKPGGTVGFRGELTSIPQNAHRYTVNFVEPENPEKQNGGG